MATAQDYKERGNAFYQRKQYKEAIEHYSQALGIDPKQHAIFTNRSAALFAQGKYEESLADALKATYLETGWVKGYYRQGAAYVALEKYDEAVLAYEKGLSKDPSNKGVKEGLAEARRLRDEKPVDHHDAKARGNELYKEGKYEEAIPWYSKALEMASADEPDFKATCLTNRAECHRQLTEIKAVVRDCTDALAFQPRNLKAFLRRGLAHEFLEKYEEGIADFKQAMSIDPSSTVASEGLRRLSKMLEMIEKRRREEEEGEDDD